MNFTHAQILELTGMTQERLRHWRREIPGLKTRASRRGIVTFEEVALLAVLSRATDEIGLPVSLIAAHYEDLLDIFRENQSVGEPDFVLWLSIDSATVSPITAPPEFEIAAVVRLAPVIEQLYSSVHHTGTRQLALSLGTSA
ncbi:DNA-binding transcriptional MerR regulator [Sphingobium sp. JAI105]|uniref:hypothetical protein n=1 Tax=Sphingobium sp. JAI105 TaxID=2787715 RepID=UPI0018C8EAD0|nr:hypothetical protein [Sphingobium sp. JAI105]MBG6118446.1 DNA-binding transcriptional MerR regulator [Sphingobium sp. JAI105]